MNFKVLVLGLGFFAVACGGAVTDGSDGTGGTGNTQEPVDCVIDDAGIVWHCAASCAAPPHGKVNLVKEPDGSFTCLWGACELGWADCDGNPENGCEADLTANSSCGACGIVCPGNLQCEGDPVQGDIHTIAHCQ